MPYVLDPELADAAASLPATDPNDPASTRRKMEDQMARLPAPDTIGLQIEDIDVPSSVGRHAVPLRVYRPEVRTASAGIYVVHGGGYVLGGLETDHAVCVDLARTLGIVVVSVGYRLAPETPYPGPHDDVFDGLCWFSDNAESFGVDPRRIAIHGTSAGGGLSAGVVLRARDEGAPRVAFQYLAVPELDDRLGTASMNEFVDTPLFNLPSAVASWDFYLGKGHRDSVDVPAYAAPARASNFDDIPPTYISVMQFDPLRDEGMAYAAALLSSGVSVELHLFPGTFHNSAQIAAKASVSQRDRAEKITVLRRGLDL